MAILLAENGNYCGKRPISLLMGEESRQKVALLIVFMLALTVLYKRWDGFHPRESRVEIGPKKGLCVGVEHPESGFGLVFVENASDIAGEAVQRLRFPESCTSISLPRVIRSGSKLVFGESNGQCLFKGVERLGGSPRLACGVGIDINRDPRENLELLPGIGPQKARKIVESRRADGPFRSVCELIRVKGVGPVTVKRLTPWLDTSELKPCLSEQRF